MPPSSCAVIESYKIMGQGRITRLGVWGLILWHFLARNKVTAIDHEGFCSTTTFAYRDALGKAILFFEGQRSGKLPESQRVKWRGNSALSDGKPENVNLIGGYYDAGDNVKFGWPMAYSVSLLSWAAVEYQREISSVNQLGYLRGAIRWGTDFILRAHTSPTTLYTQVGDGNADHQCWERPEDMDTPRTLSRITSDSPGSEAAAESAAALASASIVFKKLFEFADKHRGSYQASCPFYCSYSGYQDELLWAAAWLYKASEDNKYLDYVLSNQGWSQVVSEFSWDNKFAGAQMLLAKVDYILGKNPMKMSYMAGFGSKFPLQIHHRGASIPSIGAHPAKVSCNDGYSSYYHSSNPNPNVHVGAIVGGPDSNDQFKDLRTDYSHAEPTTYMNAAFVGSVAPLLAQSEQEYLHFFQTNRQNY
ncbi:Endoglucanase 20 [Citrus sinensis]|uniref:Endoglucanase 20 n=1 Tax=Citrus sinensis TaxID=2711 RepID=A0ACB8LPH9_CITSI|nr:Endoglucanase 20 [Citrus sinensis]